MMRSWYVAFALVSPFFFPFAFVVLIALLGAPIIPLLPLALGAIIDALYYAHGASFVPFYTLLGALASLVAYLLRSLLELRQLR